MSLKIIHSKSLRWIDIVNPTQEDINFLKKNFDFHPLDYDDIRHDSEHAKIESRDTYQLLVLTFPVYNRETREIYPGEVDFFIGKDYLITIHDGSMHTMTQLVSETHLEDAVRGDRMSKSSGMLLYHILEALFKRTFPMLDHISKDMASVEKSIFSDLSIKMLQKISLLKRNVIDFRRIMKTHHLIIKKLVSLKASYMVFPDSKQYFSSLLEHTENIWDILAIQKETMEALQDANQSLATNQLNQVIKVVTLVSAIFLPSTLVLLALGPDAKDVPLAPDHNGFWKMLGLCLVFSGLTLVFFKVKKWL